MIQNAYFRIKIMRIFKFPNSKTKMIERTLKSIIEKNYTQEVN